MSHETEKALARIPLSERGAWLQEAARLAALVERYAAIRPRRQFDVASGRYEFMPEVLALCEEARCTDPVVLAREPHRARAPSPYTLDGWLRAWRRQGPLAFLRDVAVCAPSDGRRAPVSTEALLWLDAHWRESRSPRDLYRRLEAEADRHGWAIPSESWLARRWRRLPEIVKTHLLEGKGAYEGRYAPYVPRHFGDLAALQVLCGDHSERDVTVTLADGRISRPWLSLWCDLRTGLLWGWYLGTKPCAHAAGLAYADGVATFGAQPPSRPDEGFFSYVYTDRGRDYRSHRWDGKVIAVHERAFELDGGFEYLLAERRVGALDELGLRHLLARGRNGREKPVERVHKDLSEWERNTFAEYCGRSTSTRPDAWRELFARYERIAPERRADESPFLSLDAYRTRLAERIVRYNASVHERTTLGGARVVPIEEFRRLYTTRFEIRPETLALLLMRAESRVVRKNGVQCFRKDWFYAHEALALYKGKTVEVRFSDDDYSRVWVVLPDRTLCEAKLVTPTPLVNPNKETLEAVARLKAREREIIRDFSIITQSELRGESVEHRAARAETAPPAAANDPPRPAGTVVSMTRLDRPRLAATERSGAGAISAGGEVEADWSIFEVPRRARVSEGFDDE